MSRQLSIPIVLSLLLIVCLCSSEVVPDLEYSWKTVTKVLEDEMLRHTYPGCVAAVVTEEEVLYLKEFGNFTYGAPPPLNPGGSPSVTAETIYDMASLTKVLSTTTAVMQFYQRGQLDLNTRVSSPELLGPAFGAAGKETITVENLMLHDAGFPPDPYPNYWQVPFGCPETLKEHPDENFSCQKLVYKGLMEQTLKNPVGAKYVYSDLSMITAMYIVGHLAQKYEEVSSGDLLPACVRNLTESDPEIAQCYYEAYVRNRVFQDAAMTHSGFLPAESTWPQIAPTWYDGDYLHRTIQGQVSDGNAYALGGIAGHAGLFSTVPDVINLVRKFMWASPSSSFVNSTTWEYFSTVKNLTQSSRALGWDTNDYKVNAYRGCADLSPLTWTHTGYTGTQVCGDPERQIVTILLTNRCYPDKTKTLPDIHRARQRFNTAVAAVYDAAHNPSPPQPSP